MKRTVSVSKAAEDDIDRLTDFLMGRDIRAALNVADLLWSAVASLREFSERGVPGRRPGHRALFVPFGRGAYVIHYVVYERSVVVIQIFHSLEDRPLA
ncbi:MAG: type II toxin-antitoxin system RelE/ParE family toxin [Caulobacter sp.]|nr:type II toxin-antitoxin system RelE/ParE family toxin [Caulobacter sp.]